jgi:hypothetical protein
MDLLRERLKKQVVRNMEPPYRQRLHTATCIWRHLHAWGVPTRTGIQSMCVEEAHTLHVSIWSNMGSIHRLRVVHIRTCQSQGYIARRV